MKAEGVGNTTYPEIVASAKQPKAPKKHVASFSRQPVDKGAIDLVPGIERAERIAEKVSLKLQEMATLLHRIQGEKDDIVCSQLARFFNVLRAFIDEALHPTGDWATDQILSGKTINVNTGDSGATTDAKGELMNMGAKGLNISELPKSPKNNDILAMVEDVSKAQASVKRLRNSLASAKVHIAHHSKGSSAITV